MNQSSVHNDPVIQKFENKGENGKKVKKSDFHYASGEKQCG